MGKLYLRRISQTNKGVNSTEVTLGRGEETGYRIYFSFIRCSTTGTRVLERDLQFRKWGCSRFGTKDVIILRPLLSQEFWGWNPLFSFTFYLSIPLPLSTLFHLPSLLISSTVPHQTPAAILSHALFLLLSSLPIPFVVKTNKNGFALYATILTTTCHTERSKPRSTGWNFNYVNIKVPVSCSSCRFLKLFNFFFFPSPFPFK